MAEIPGDNGDSKELNGSVVMTQVKSVNFDDLMKSDIGVSSGADTPPYEDLATIEQNKKQVQRYVHEQESFWSWFCCRCLCCDGYFPYFVCPDCFWVGSGDCCACACDECCGECCAGCGNCLEACCLGCGEGCSGVDCGSCC